MEPILIFFGPWTIEVISLTLGAGAPSIRVTLDQTGNADGTYLNPPVGTVFEPEAPEWVLKIEVAFDLQPFHALKPSRIYSFDPTRGITATVTAAKQLSAFKAAIILRMVAQDPEMRARPADPYDFTIAGER